MRKKINTFLLGCVPFLVILLLWQLFYQYAIVPHWLIPSPWETFQEFLEMLFDGTIIHVLLRSGYNAIPAFLLASVVSVLLGVVIGVSGFADALSRPFLSALYTVPSLAWLPLIILLLGFSRESLWCVIFVSAFTKMIYNVIDGVRGVRVEWILIGQNFGLSYMAQMLQIILPAAFPSILTGLRLGFAASWRSLVGAEMLVMTLGGIGRFIWLAQWSFEYGKVIVGVIVVSLVGILMERLFLLVESRTLVRWGWLRS